MSAFFNAIVREVMNGEVRRVRDFPLVFVSRRLKSAEIPRSRSGGLWENLEEARFSSMDSRFVMR